MEGHDDSYQPVKNATYETFQSADVGLNTPSSSRDADSGEKLPHPSGSKDPARVARCRHLGKRNRAHDRINKLSGAALYRAAATATRQREVQVRRAVEEAAALVLSFPTQTRGQREAALAEESMLADNDNEDLLPAHAYLVYYVVCCQMRML